MRMIDESDKLRKKELSYMREKVKDDRIKASEVKELEDLIQESKKLNPTWYAQLLSKTRSFIDTTRKWKQDKEERQIKTLTRKKQLAKLQNKKMPQNASNSIMSVEHKQDLGMKSWFK